MPLEKPSIHECSATEYRQRREQIQHYLDDVWRVMAGVSDVSSSLSGQAAKMMSRDTPIDDLRAYLQQVATDGKSIEATGRAMATGAMLMVNLIDGDSEVRHGAS